MIIRHAARRGHGVLSCIGGLILCMVLCPMLVAQDGKAALTPADAQAVFGIVRSLADPAAPAPQIPERLQRPSDTPLIVTLHRAALPIQREAAGATLAESAARIGVELGDALARLPGGRASLADSRMQVDVVTQREALPEKARVAQHVRPGLDGLEIVTPKGEVFHFSPLRVWMALHDLDPVRRLFVTQESMPAPAEYSAFRLCADTFVEESPRGEVVALFRGNVLVPPPHAEAMIESVTRAGLWFLRTQREDGVFITLYNPAIEVASEEIDFSAHLRATLAVLLLHQLTAEPRFDAAAERAIARVLLPDALRTEEDASYVAARQDEIAASALLLQALCARALVRGGGATPTMRQIGEFLLSRIGQDGMLRAGTGVRSVAGMALIRGGPYAETLLALDLLHRIAPGEATRAGAERMADILARPMREQPLRFDARATARAIEALAFHYRMQRAERHAGAVFQLSEMLLTHQVGGEITSFLDFTGGFAESGQAPDAFTTGASVAALAAAYETSLLARRPVGRFSGPIRSAARFLMNLQYRPENSFFLPRQQALLGAYRTSPMYLSLTSAATAEAVRALATGATVTAETVAPAP